MISNGKNKQLKEKNRNGKRDAEWKKKMKKRRYILNGLVLISAEEKQKGTELLLPLKPWCVCGLYREVDDKMMITEKEKKLKFLYCRETEGEFTCLLTSVIVSFLKR